MGTAPPAMLADCMDNGGLIAIGTGSGTTFGVLLTVTFAQPISLVPPESSVTTLLPGLSLTPFNDLSSQLGYSVSPNYSGTTLIGFQIVVHNPPAASQPVGEYGFWFNVQH
jgi:hypothetical protein